METAMTVTELVRDTTKEAEERIRRGDSITIRNGRRIVFRIVPPEPAHNTPSESAIKAFARDVETLSGALDSNPVLKLRERRP